MIGTQCKGCTKYKKGKCTRIGTSNKNKGKVGICWMDTGEEY